MSFKLNLLIISALITVSSCKKEVGSNGNFILGNSSPPYGTSFRRLNSALVRSGATISAALTFNQEIVGLNLEDFSVTRLSGDILVTVDSFSTVNNIDYVIALSYTGKGRFRLEFNDANQSIVDYTGQKLTPHTLSSEEFKIIALGTVNLTSITRGSVPASNPTTAFNAEYDVTFDGDVTNLTVDDFYFPYGTIDSISGSGSNWTVSVTAPNYELVARLDFRDEDATVLDLFGDELQTLTYTAGQAWTFDREYPTLEIIARAAGDNPTSATEVVFLLRFSEEVFSVQASDFVVTNTGIGTPTITNIVKFSDPNYPQFYFVSVDVSGVDGEVGLDLNDADASIEDAGSRSLSPLTHVSDETWTVIP